MTVSEPISVMRARAIHKPPVVLYALLALLGLVNLLYQARAAKDQIGHILHYTPAARAPFWMKGYPARISTLEPEAVAAGLRIGDEVVTLNGERILGRNTIARVLAALRPGQILRTEQLRDGQRVQSNIRLEVFPHGNQTLDAILSVILGMCMPWFALVLGFYVAAVRPRDPLAWIVLGLLVSFSQLVQGDMSAWGSWIRIGAEILHFAGTSTWPLFMFLFGYYFPQVPRWHARFPWIKNAVSGVFIVLASLTTVVLVGTSENLEVFGRLYAAQSRIAIAENVFFFGVVLAGIWFLAQKTFWHVGSADARRRLRLLFAGLTGSMTPVFVLSLITLATGHSMDGLPDVIVIPSVLALLFFPVTLAYVIVVDRAMDVRVAIRQGLQYAFARSGLAVLRVALNVGIFVCGYALIRQLHGSVPGIIAVCSVCVIAAIQSNRGLRRWGRWIDKRFFREAYDAELVLSELSAQVRTIRETQPLMEMVCRRISGALHLSRISVLLEDNGRFSTCHSEGVAAPRHVEFGNDSAIISYLHQATEPPQVYFDDDSSWLYRTPGLDDDQRSRLAYLGAELLLPLSARDRLLGFIAVGQKRSEEPYTKSDIRILSSVATQTGLALENAQLTIAIASEMAQRERLAREVEIAREVQERLFPQKLPPVAGLDYFGMCRTALGVGGDYYDFLALPEERFGFALGDVAGKGISAALLMASLQASLRAEAAHGTDDVAQLIGNLNDRVFESSGANRYATFFYGQYTPATRQLIYVNAGHNPPMVIRHENDRRTKTLEATGTVVGLLHNAKYEQATCQLHPGDYLILFTDGISEAMNGMDEEWGEECLAEAASACARASLSAAETTRRILSAADTFVNGAKQHDDMTIVVLRGL